MEAEARGSVRRSARARGLNCYRCASYRSVSCIHANQNAPKLGLGYQSLHTMIRIQHAGGWEEKCRRRSYWSIE